MNYTKEKYIKDLEILRFKRNKKTINDIEDTVLGTLELVENLIL